jgi:hypothetical protein
MTAYNLAGGYQRLGENTASIVSPKDGAGYALQTVGTYLMYNNMVS